MPKTPGEKKSFKAGIVKGMTLVDEGLPGWFGTFADMMTLLFAFFVLLAALSTICLLYTSPSPRDGLLSRMPSSA